MWQYTHRASFTGWSRCLRIALVALLLLGSSAHAAHVEIFDRASGATLPVFEYEGRTYVVGEPGNEYEIRVRSAQGQRMLAVTSVDGVNVVTGQTAAASQSGYVIDPYGFVRIEGWRKSLTQTAAFYFTKLGNSYAARTGRPDNVGVIGVALFSERKACCADQELSRSEDGAAGATTNAAPAQRSRAQEADKSLGTEHGRTEYSAASYTGFARASTAPDEIIRIYYDSRRNLVSRGVIPPGGRYAQRVPEAFPQGFVPDP